ncbi:o-succinylbenzoate synthase [Prochlorococcus sp. MIT 1307]|uniref:o-succinylbenzoate synthase n=1 Tax=Prochlorococcus sp. MIT 1307 TaxID=3096219 RepID=UPI002A765D10|nr:o-succinylbenzoate synthase [Prochlorococcus sp. MIT 1307]
MRLSIHIKPFSFRLIKRLKTSQGIIEEKKGWLIHLENALGKSGWGEVSSLSHSEIAISGNLLKSLGNKISHDELETNLPFWPESLAFGVGAALGELNGLIGIGSDADWLPAPRSAILLSNNQSVLKEIDILLNNLETNQHPLTLKWKIGLEATQKEEALLFQILERLPNNARLRLDANGGLDRIQSKQWAQHFLTEPQLEWLEQPLPADDLEGLAELAKNIPIALDESLLMQPSLRKSWQSWQVRRPTLEGDPRALLQELKKKASYKMISTTFETGIGLRWIHHLAALQQQGPTPTAPGFAPGWCPNSLLFSNNPHDVWEAA